MASLKVPGPLSAFEVTINVSAKEPLQNSQQTTVASIFNCIFKNAVLQAE
jgi:hypothetical protein